MLDVPMQRSSLAAAKTQLKMRPDAECWVFRDLAKGCGAGRREKPRWGMHCMTVP